MDRYERGKHAEEYVRKRLESRGWICYAERLRTPYGEIDLLMQDNETLVIIEVKYRSTPFQGGEVLSLHQRKRLSRAGLYAWERWPLPGIRFDLVRFLNRDIFYMKNAWSLEDDG